MDKYQELEKRIKKLEEDSIKVTMTKTSDTNVLRSAQRALLNGQLTIGSSGQTSANYSSLLVLNSIDKGLLFSRMTTAQRDAIINPVAGLVIYNTTTNLLNFHNGTVWGAV